jgi:hypothetical protein
VHRSDAQDTLATVAESPAREEPPLIREALEATALGSAAPEVSAQQASAARAGETKGEVRQHYATVVGEAAGTLTVRVEDRVVSARRAASCLLEPRPGDQVLVAVGGGLSSFVLAVLVRGEVSARGAQLSVDGDLTLKTTSGKLSLTGAEGVSIASAKEVAVSAPEVAVRALSTTFFSESLSYIGRRVEAEIDKLKVAAHALDSAIDRVSERVKRSHRTVEEVEHVKAKELDVVVEGNASVHAENTLLSADKLVKLDGEQVHIG